jgi:hypothetical protein
VSRRAAARSGSRSMLVWSSCCLSLRCQCQDGVPPALPDRADGGAKETGVVGGEPLRLASGQPEGLGRSSTADQFTVLAARACRGERVGVIFGSRLRQGAVERRAGLVQQQRVRLGRHRAVTLDKHRATMLHHRRRVIGHVRCRSTSFIFGSFSWGLGRSWAKTATGPWSDFVFNLSNVKAVAPQLVAHANVPSDGVTAQA